MPINTEFMSWNLAFFKPQEGSINSVGYTYDLFQNDENVAPIWWDAYQ